MMGRHYEWMWGGGANPCQSHYAIVFIIKYFTLHLEQEHIYIEMTYVGN